MADACVLPGDHRIDGLTDAASQVCILAAGYCTRAYRLKQGDTRVRCFPVVPAQA